MSGRADRAQAGAKVRRLLRRNAGLLVSLVSSMPEDTREAIVGAYRRDGAAVFGDSPEGAALWYVAVMKVQAALRRMGVDVTPAQLHAAVIGMARNGSVSLWRNVLALAVEQRTAEMPAAGSGG